MTFASEEYLNQLQTYHRMKEYTWGTGPPIVSKYPRIFSAYERHECTSILDYGCGSGSFKKYLDRDVDVREYDIAVPEKSSAPDNADFVVCFDVMEHVEEDYVDSVLDHIRSLANRAAYFEICVWKAMAILPDGRNAHVTIKSHEWWRDKLDKYFDCDGLDQRPPAHLFYCGTPKK